MLRTCTIQTTVLIFPLMQTSLRFDALIEKIYVVIQFLPSSLVSGEDLQHCCYTKMYYVRTVSLPDVDAEFGNDYCIQITETGFAEKF
jgi:hypothetical protein